jgi:hypothetical protein
VQNRISLHVLKLLGVTADQQVFFLIIGFGSNDKSLAAHGRLPQTKRVERSCTHASMTRTEAN